LRNGIYDSFRYDFRFDPDDDGVTVHLTDGVTVHITDGITVHVTDGLTVHVTMA
jgi:hypothetical protein